MTGYVRSCENNACSFSLRNRASARPLSSPASSHWFKTDKTDSPTFGTTDVWTRSFSLWRAALCTVGCSVAYLASLTPGPPPTKSYFQTLPTVLPEAKLPCGELLLTSLLAEANYQQPHLPPVTFLRRKHWKNRELNFTVLQNGLCEPFGTCLLIHFRSATSCLYGGIGLERCLHYHLVITW